MAKRSRKKRNGQKNAQKGTAKKKSGLSGKLAQLLGASTVLSLTMKLTALLIAAVMLTSVIAALICVVLAVVQAVQGLITSISGMDSSGIGKHNQTVTAGAVYEWNVTDLEKMPDEWSKNLYRLAWLCDANKAAQKSDAPINLLMGIPVLEAGSMFFPVSGDGLGYADGKGKAWNNLSIAEYATVGGAFPTVTESDYITGLYATDARYLSANTKVLNCATWGDMPHSRELDTAVLGDRHIGYIAEYADGDVNRSVYSAAVSVANTVYMYDTYASSMLTADADYGYGHSYGKYYRAACERYGINAEDLAVQRQIYSMLYYLVHAGGVWNHTDIADDFYYMALDYAVFVYTQMADGDLDSLSLSSNYTDGNCIRSLGSDVLKAAARGNGNIGHYNAESWAEPAISAVYLSKKLDDSCNSEDLTNSLVGYWMANNENTDWSWYNARYAEIYVHKDKTLVRQGEYAFSTGYMAIFAGNARLDYIFGILDVSYTVDIKTGYVCCGVSGGESGSVPDGYNAGVFDTGNSNKTGYSNYREAEWFASINNSEWANPLNPTLNGGFGVTSRYGFRSYGGWTWHSGIDLAYSSKTGNLAFLRENCPVYAMHDGEIVYANLNIGSDAGRYLHYRVNYVRNGVPVTRYFTYMHLSGFTPEIEAEAVNRLGAGGKGVLSIPVKAGQCIGYMGGSGNGSEFGYAVHLHISMSVYSGVNGNQGRVDIETELPFMTMYRGYCNWWGGTGTDMEGYLRQKPSNEITPDTEDPQIALQ